MNRLLQIFKIVEDTQSPSDVTKLATGIQLRISAAENVRGAQYNIHEVSNSIRVRGYKETSADINPRGVLQAASPTKRSR